jgi:hypothetical protein
MCDIEFIDDKGSHIIHSEEREHFFRKAKRATKAIFKHRQVKKMRPER